MVEDLGNANGIIFNGEHVETTSLKPGDSFKIGQTTFFLVEREVAKTKDPLRTTLMLLSATIADIVSPAIGDGTDHSSGRLMDIISEIPFFVPLKESEGRHLAEAATMHVFNPGEMILPEGHAGRSVYVILDGRVKVFVKEKAESDLELGTLGVGQFFGTTSLLSGQPRSSAVAALESTVLVEFSYACMAKVMKRNAAVKNILMQYYKSSKPVFQEKISQSPQTSHVEYLQ